MSAVKIGTNVIRLPLDLVFVTVDLLGALWVGLTGRFSDRAPPCAFCYNPEDIETFPRPCRASVKYGNRWLFRLVCPCSKPADGGADNRMSVCDRTGRFRCSFHHLALAVVLGALWTVVVGGVLWQVGAAPRLAALFSRGARGPGDAIVAKRDGLLYHETVAKDPAKAATLLADANLLAANGSYEEARITYLNARKLDPENAKIRFGLGSLHFDLEAWPNAMVELKHAVRLDPKFAEAHIKLAETAFKLRQRDLGIEHATIARDLAPDDVSLYIFLAKAYLLTRNKELLRKEAAAALELDGDNADTSATLAALHIRISDAPAAERLYRRALEADPEHARSRIGLAAVLRLQRRPAEASEILNSAKSLDPSNIDVRIQLAEIAAAEGRWADAIRDYRIIVDIAPERHQPMARLAELLMVTGQIDQGQRVALRLAEGNDPRGIIAGNLVLARMYMVHGMFTAASENARRVLAVDDTDVEARLLLAKALFSQAEYTEAEAELRELLELNEDFLEASLLLGRAQLARGQVEDAIDTYEAIAESHPGSPTANLALGNYFLQQGDDRIDDAQWHLAEALRRDPRNFLAANNLAMLLLDHDGDANRAHELATELDRLYPGNAAVADTLGWALLHRGEIAEALTRLRAATQGLPRHPEIRYHLGAALYEAGDFAAAKRELETALTLAEGFPGAAKALAMLAQINSEK